LCGLEHTFTTGQTAQSTASGLTTNGKEND
jgi:hypothetical protein